MAEEREVKAFVVDRLGHVERRDDKVIATFFLGDDAEIGVVLPAFTADELTGALIHLPQSGYGKAALGSSQELHADVTDHEVRQVEEDVFVVQLSAEQGQTLTFRMGTRRVRRMRDALTAMLLRKEAQQVQ